MKLCGIEMTSLRFVFSRNRKTGYALLVVIRVHGPGLLGLGPAGPLGHDDLVDPQDGARRIDGVLEAPVLDGQQVEDLGLLGVDDGGGVAGLDVEGGVLLALLVGGHEGVDGDAALGAGVLGELAGDGGEGVGELLDGVLLEAGAGLGVGADLAGELHLGGAAAGDDAGVLGWIKITHG